MREANARANAGAYRLILGDIDGVEEEARVSLELCRQLQSPQMTVCAIEHLANVAAARNDSRTAARLSGYIDAWYARESLEREWTEQQGYELLARRLREILGEADLVRYRAEGAGLSEDEATAEALAAGRPSGLTNVKPPVHP